MPASGTTAAAVSASVGVSNSNNSAYSFLFLWGDGNYIITPAGTGTGTHTYSNASNYSVIAMALLGGNVVGTASGNIQISQGAVSSSPQAAPVVGGTQPTGSTTTPTSTSATAPTPVLPPSLQITVPATGVVGKPVSASAQVSNYGPVAVNFSWGNGANMLSQPGNNNVNYAYSKPGIYLVTVSVTINSTTISKTAGISISPAPVVAK